MSKDEKHHRHEHRLRRCCGCMASCLLALVLVVAFVALVVYLALRPSKPAFYLQDLQLRRPVSLLGDPSQLTASAQVTLASRNPNDRVGVFYRRLDVFVTYRDEPVTVPVSLPPLYQGHRDVSVWSPVLAAEAVPVAGYVADAMRQDVAAGFLALQVKVDGRVRWKVGAWVSGSYHLFVSCPAVLSAAYPDANNNNATTAVTSLKFAQPTACSVEV